MFKLTFGEISIFSILISLLVIKSNVPFPYNRVEKSCSILESPCDAPKRTFAVKLMSLKLKVLLGIST